MNEQLRDIKPLLEIPDIGYYFYFEIFILIILLIVLFLIFFKYKNLFLKRKEDKNREYFKQLKSINWNNSKESAYELTLLGRKLAKDEASIKIYNQLLLLLEPYKYKKEVPLVDEETIDLYYLFLISLNSSYSF